MTFRISRRGNADIEAICDYIAKDNPEAADRLDERIHAAIQMLAQFPGMGHGRLDVTDTRYLFWTVGNYVIAYRVSNQVRTPHGADTAVLHRQAEARAGNESILAKAFVLPSLARNECMCDVQALSG